MAKDLETNPLVLGKYMIVINGPPRAEFGGRTHYYDIDLYGSGYVEVYKILEGRTPSLYEVGHIRCLEGFPLQQKENKTLGEFMQEVKKGIEKFVPSSESE